MGAWIGDVTPEAQAERCASRSGRQGYDEGAVSGRSTDSPSGSGARRGAGRRRGGSTSSASTPTTTTGSCSPWRSTAARRSRSATVTTGCCASRRVTTPTPSHPPRRLSPDADRPGRRTRSASPGRSASTVPTRTRARRRPLHRLRRADRRGALVVGRHRVRGALALDEHWGLGFDRPTLAKIGRLAENRVVGAPTGIMDQTASLIGEPDSAVFLDCRSLDADVIPLGIRGRRMSLLVIDTRVSHAHATGGYASRRASAKRGPALGVESLREVRLDDLGRAAELLTARRSAASARRHREPARARHRAHPARAWARRDRPFLDASHVSMRDDSRSRCRLDLAVETAQGTGAIGARMTGGGFGGSAIALVIDALVPVVAREVVAAFADQGSASRSSSPWGRARGPGGTSDLCRTHPPHRHSQLGAQPGCSQHAGMQVQSSTSMSLAGWLPRDRPFSPPARQRRCHSAWAGHRSGRCRARPDADRGAPGGDTTPWAPGGVESTR